MNRKLERGPTYGVELLDSLPLDGGQMQQALPRRGDLILVQEISERTAAGYEVLLEHYRRAVAECERLRNELTDADTAMAKIDSGWPNYREIAAEYFRGRETVAEASGGKR